MQYYYIPSSSLAHARNFKYIKREPDGKGGWRYYYDIKKHGSDIKRNIENKTGITARNKMNNARVRANQAAANVNVTKVARKNAIDRAHDSYHKQVNALEKYMIKGDRVSGEAYRDASLRTDELYRKHKETVSDQKRAEAKQRIADSEYNKAKKEYESIPLVKLSKEVKAGADKVKKWFEAPVGVKEREAKEKSEEKLTKTKKDLDKAYNKETDMYNIINDLYALEKANDNYEKAKKDHKNASDKYSDTKIGMIEKELDSLADKLGVDEHATVKEAYGKKADAELAKNAAYASYRLNQELDAIDKQASIDKLKIKTKEHDAALTEFNAAKDEYLNTPLGKLDKASGHFKEDGAHFFNEYFDKKRAHKR